MSFIGSMFSGDKGAGFEGQKAPLINTTNADQIAHGYDQSADALEKQKAFVNALNAQNGLGNQNQVYGQLQNIASGTGPNPAQAALNQATGNNISSQAALMGSARGVGANPGLIARQAALQGGSLQQQAVGQAATMQAQQQLGAIQAAGALANQQAQQQAQGVMGYNQAAQSEQANLLGAGASQNNANVQMQNSINDVNSKIAAGNQKGQQDMFGNLVGAAGKAAMLAKGGAVPGYDIGGPVAPDVRTAPVSNVGNFLFGSAPKPFAYDPGANLMGTPGEPPSALAQGSQAAGNALGSGLKKLFGGSGGGSTELAGGAMDNMGGGAGAMDSLGGEGAAAMFAAKGGKVPAKVSPGEVYIPPQQVKKVAQGKEAPLKAGEKIKGKARVKGDSYENDTVSKQLESGGIVLPRSVTTAKDAPQKAAEFVAAILAKQNLKKPA